MKKIDLRGLSIEQLVTLFTEIALAQDRAEFEGNIKKYNKLYDQIQAVQSELKGREGEQRKALVALHQHPNAQVRLMAAHATLVIAPKAARDTLQALSESRIFPQAASAGMALDRLDSGKYKPT